ncbi:MAG TPA: hypothetical protein VIQ02_04500 [Jiangellaceae bacterium]
MEVAELERGHQILDTALRTRANVAVADIDLQGLDGLTAAEQLGADSAQQLWIPISAATFGPDTRLSVHEEPLMEL